MTDEIVAQNSKKICMQSLWIVMICKTREISLQNEEVFFILHSIWWFLLLDLFWKLPLSPPSPLSPDNPGGQNPQSSPR